MTDRKEPIGVISWFIARRYLVARERKALLSTITLISMLGVAVGVAALIIVIGIMDGAEVDLYGKMSNLFPHLKIGNADGSPLWVTKDLLDTITRDPDVLWVRPVLEQNESAVLTDNGAGGQNAKFISIRGTDDLATDPIFKDVIDRRGLTPEALKLGPHEIMLGKPLAETLRAKIGGVAAVITVGKTKNALYPPMSREPLHVKAIFSSGFYAFDSLAAFVSNAELRRMFGMKEGTATYLWVRLKDPFRAEKVRDRLNLPMQFSVMTWSYLSNDFFTALTVEKYALFIILLLIILVAAFNIIGTLVLMVIDKTREVGILRALGASEGLIMRIFVLDGISIGALGTLLGMILGVAIGLILPLIKIPMPQQVYNFNYLPVRINAITVTLIVLSSMTISTLAAIFPARQAAKLNPVEALRYD